MDTLRLIESARSGDQWAREALAKSARDGLRDLWSSNRSPLNTEAVAELSEKAVARLIEFFPLPLRQGVAEALSEVEQLATLEGLPNEGNDLLSLYRKTHDLVRTDTLPASLRLWIALDRLDQAFRQMHSFKQKPEVFASKELQRRLLSADQRVKAKRPRVGNKPRGAQQIDDEAPSIAKRNRDICTRAEELHYPEKAGRNKGKEVVVTLMGEFECRESAIRAALKAGGLVRTRRILR